MLATSPTTTIASPPVLSHAGARTRHPSTIVTVKTAKPSPAATASSGTDNASWSISHCQRGRCGRIAPVVISLCGRRSLLDQIGEDLRIHELPVDELDSESLAETRCGLVAAESESTSHR